MADRVGPDGAAHVERAMLDNGLTLVVQEEHTAPLASVWCWYRVGSKDETPGKTGASHWVEHMNFRGTTNIPREQVKGIIEQFGGTWNGYTWIDQTAYVETAARDALDRMLFIESERMAGCLYDPEDCEAERTVIIAELQGAENDPDQLLDQEVTAAAFTAHPYRHPTIGWLSDLQTMTRDDLYEYYRRYYAPGNAVLVVVGDVEAGDVRRRVERRFGGIPPAPPPQRVLAVEPPQTAERRVTLRRPGTASYLKIAYRAPAASSPLFVPALALDAILTGAKGINIWSSFRVPPPQRKSRLYRALVDGGLASSVHGALLPTEHPFLYTLSVAATDGTPLDAVEAAVAHELDRVRTAGVMPDEVARARAQLRACLVFDRDSVTNIAHQLGYFETIGAPGVLGAMDSTLAALDADGVSAAARELLDPRARTVGWFDAQPS